MSYLLIRWGEEVVASLPVADELTIGRDPANRFFLPDPKVSRRHARIHKTPSGRYSIQDLNSWNGTYLNGRKISQAELKEGDFIQIGNTILEFSCSAHPKSVITERLARKAALEQPRTSESKIFIRAAEILRKARILEGYAGALIEVIESALADTSAWVVLFGSQKKRITFKRERGNLIRLFSDPPFLDDYIKKPVESGQAVSTVKGDAKEPLAIGIAPIEELGATAGYIIAVRQKKEILSQELELLNAIGYFSGLCLSQLKERDELLAELRFRPRSATIESLVGRSRAIQHIKDQIIRFAPQRTPVTIIGDTGVGKELVARALHAHAPWRNKPFVTFNCASVPETLAESELFGHEKGAFTGALEFRKGRFEAAHLGTLFLDEIGEMSLELQAKILRAIETGEIQKVGSSELIHVNTRVIAATNRDLKRDVKAGKFREDLFFRINVLEIFIPPLREHLEDIEDLSTHFIEMFSSPSSPSRYTLSQATLDAMRSYSWPGNIRELRNIIERACVLCETNEEFETMLREYALGRTTFEPDVGELTLSEKVASTERLEILKVLRRYGGNKSKAAAVLGITRQTLDRKLEQYALTDIVELLKKKGE